MIEYFNPTFPRQNLENIKTNQCFYVLNSVGVKVLIDDARSDVKPITMSMLSDLFTDMISNGATKDEIIRAVNCSMSVMRGNLDSFNDISDLIEKYKTIEGVNNYEHCVQ